MCTFQCRGACEGLALGFLIWIFKPPYLDPVFFFFFFPSCRIFFTSPFLFLSPSFSYPLLYYGKREKARRGRESVCAGMHIHKNT